MNLHPIIVHFPIALLFIWSFIELLPLKKWLPRIHWQSIADVLLALGVLGAFFALQSGETARHIIGRNPIISVHSSFAQVTSFLYGLFLAELVIIVVVRFIAEKQLTFPLQKPFLWLCNLYLKIIQFKPLRILLVIAALLTLFMTGLLGGAIVYGTTADPLTKIILPWFGISA